MTGPSESLRFARAKPALVDLAVSGALAPYTHVQSAAATTWYVNHNLGFEPVVEVLSPGGVKVDANIQHVSVNQAVVRFNTAQSGRAIAR